MAVLVRSNGLMTTRVVLGLSQVYIHALRQTEIRVGPFQSVDFLYLHGIYVHHAVYVFLYYGECYVSVLIREHHSTLQYLIVVAVVTAVTYAVAGHLMISAPTVLATEKIFGGAHLVGVAASESVETVAFVLVESAECYVVIVLERLKKDVVFGSCSHGKVAKEVCRRR